MILFLFALAVAVVGLAAYAHYNPGVQDITLRGYHFTGVPLWTPMGLAAGVPLLLFLLHAVSARVRIALLRRSRRRQETGAGAGEEWGSRSVRPGPKRSWTSGE